jgi:predicted RNA binding protein YcfA (HicA-like mRNA interferase family)
MPELRKVSGEDTVRALRRLGFERARQRGSHVVLKKQTEKGAVGCVVPLHGELKIGTLKGILRQAKVASQEFMDNL